MSTPHSTVLAVLCVDWRMHHPKSNFMQVLYEYLGKPDRIYVITYPGPDGLCDALQSGERRTHFEETITRTRDVLRDAGVDAARHVLVVHSECAGHRVDDASHRSHACAVAESFDTELHTSSHFEPLIAVKGASDYEWRLEEAHAPLSLSVCEQCVPLQSAAAR